MHRWLFLLLFLPSIVLADFGRDPVLIKGEWHFTKELDMSVDLELYYFVTAAIEDAAVRMDVTGGIPVPTIVFTSTTYMKWLFDTLMNTADVTTLDPIALYFNNTIYLPYTLDLSELQERGYVYHEGVHHVQAHTKKWEDLIATNVVCFNFMRESEAYDLQAAWLAMQQTADPKVFFSVRLLRANARKYRAHCPEIVP